jgi:hypothetical protein
MMMQSPSTRARSQPAPTAHNSLRAARLLLFPLFLVLAMFAALPSLIVGLLLWWRTVAAFDRREFWRGLWAAAVFGVICYIVWIWLADPLPGLVANLFTDTARHLWRQAAQVTGLLWLFNLWLAPLVAPVLVGLYPRGLVLSQSQVAAPKQPAPIQYQREEDEQIAQQLVQLEKMTASMQEASQTSSRALVPPMTGAPVLPAGTILQQLGHYEGGELAELVYSGALCLPPELLAVHGVIAGEPGAGKTTTLIKLAAIARSYGCRVIYLDLKGSRKTAALFLAAMAALGINDARVYPLAAFDGWRGDAQALYNKLMQQIDPKSHPFYRVGVGSAIVSLAVKAPAGPPRSSYQFLERLDSDWLKAAYAGDPQALREIRDVAPHIGGLALVFAGFFRGIGGALDGQWSYEDAPASYIGIDGVAHREEAGILGRFLLDDAAHFATVRKPPNEQALFIIDEFGVLGSTNATGLYEQVREAGMSIYASGQSYHALGAERDALLAAAPVKILHKTGAPLPFIQYAGEREVFKFSRSVGGGGDEAEDLLHPLANRPEQAQGIMRPDKEYAVRVEDVQQLPVGKVAVIVSGQGAYVQVQPLEIPQVLLQAASRFIRTAPRFTPAPPPPLPPQSQQSQSNQSQQQKRKPAPAGGTKKRPQHSQLGPPKTSQAAPGPAKKGQKSSQQQPTKSAAAAPQVSQQAQPSPTPAPSQPPPQEDDTDFFS